MNREDLLRLRLHNQRLTGAGFSSGAEAVHGLLAVQSQDFPGAKWALGQRVPSATSTSIQAEFDAGKILRTHVMRPTWHFVSPEDIRWLQRLTAPRVHALCAYQNRKEGLDTKTFTRALVAIEKALVGGRSRTRTELASELKKARVEAAGPRLANILIHAELEGLICSGACRGKQSTYALLEERVPAVRSRTEDEALAELVRRYFESRGPAQVADVAWWSGLTIKAVNRGLEAVKGKLASDSFDGKTFWLGQGTKPAGARRPVFHLLPNFDEFIVAYRDRDALLHAAFRADPKRIGMAVLAHAMIVNGELIGGWRRETSGRGVTVTMNPAMPFDRSLRAGFEMAEENYRKFLQSSVTAS